jgi:hypothetical protein
MGDQWWLFLAGVALWAVTITAIVFGKKTSNTGCPVCEHEAGLDERRKHCPAQDDNNGWSSHLCQCQNDYHWNYESTISA